MEIKDISESKSIVDSPFPRVRFFDGITEQLIFNCDCRDGLKHISNEFIDLSICHPPLFNIKCKDIDSLPMKFQQMGLGNNYEEYIAEMTIIFQENFRVMKEGKYFILIINDELIESFISFKSRRKLPSFYPIASDLTKILHNIGFNYLGKILWNKQIEGNIPQCLFDSNPYPPNIFIPQILESVLIFRKGDLITAQKSNGDLKNKLPQHIIKQYISQIWDIKNEIHQIHHDILPIELTNRLISLFSLPNDIILDSFCGIATTLASGKRLYRNSIGFEIDPSYIPFQEKRIGKFKSIDQYFQ